MPRQPFDPPRMRRALSLLDKRLPEAAHLVIGGGAAMVLAYDHPISTQDVDAFAAKGGLRMSDLDAFARQVGDELDVQQDWLNSHFETFTAVLPNDYASRLRRVYSGRQLTVDALGPEDVLIMKCFAGRDKDRPHARKLLRLVADLGVVERRLAELEQRRYPGTSAAADFFDDLRDEADL